MRVTGDTGEDFVAAEPTILARVPVLRYAEGGAAGVYAPLGASPAAVKERAAACHRAAHRTICSCSANYRAHWSGIGDPERRAVEVDVTDSYDDDFSLCLPPISSGVIYVEVRLRCAWLGTCLIIHGLRLQTKLDEQLGSGGPVQGLFIPSFGANSWSWCRRSSDFWCAGGHGQRVRDPSSHPSRRAVRAISGCPAEGPSPRGSSFTGCYRSGLAAGHHLVRDPAAPPSLLVAAEEPIRGGAPVAPDARGVTSWMPNTQKSQSRRRRRATRGVASTTRAAAPNVSRSAAAARNGLSRPSRPSW